MEAGAVQQNNMLRAALSPAGSYVILKRQSLEIPALQSYNQQRGWFVDAI